MDLSQFNGSEFGIEANTKQEADYFLNHLHSNHTVLEWGSGASTHTISKKVKKLYSIEHNKEWFDIVNKTLPENAKLYYIPHNEEEAPGMDGNYEQYKNYINKAFEISLENNIKFDIIFIDGRARVECAKICQSISHENTLIFIHDYNHPDPKYTRTEYFEAEQYLTRIKGEHTMWKFKVK